MSPTCRHISESVQTRPSLITSFEGKTDRELYVEMRRIADELVRRYEQYLELVPARNAKREAGKD